MILLKWSKYQGEYYYIKKDMYPYSGDIRELLSRPVKGLNSSNFSPGLFDAISDATDGEKIWLPITYSKIVEEALIDTICSFITRAEENNVEISNEKCVYLRNNLGNPNEDLKQVLERNKNLFNFDISEEEFIDFIQDEYAIYVQEKTSQKLGWNMKKFAKEYIDKNFMYSTGPENKVVYFLIDMEDGLNGCIEFSLFLSHIIENTSIQPNHDRKEDNTFLDEILEEEFKDDKKEELEEDTGEDEFEKFMEKAETIENNSVNNITNVILYDSNGFSRYSLTALFNEIDDSVDIKLKRINKGE